MDRKISFGIIGCGTIARWHADAIRTFNCAELLGVTDSNQESARDFAEKYGVKVFGSLENMLSCADIDGVCICTPSGFHASQAMMSAQAGKHIIIEKPMALDLKSADAVIAACEASKVKVAVIAQLRFAPAVRKMKDALDSGLLGKITSADLSMKFHRSQEYYDSKNWRGTWDLDGGGALMNQGIHGIDLLRFMMGPVKIISAMTRTLVRRIEAEDTAVAILEYANGALGAIQATTSIFPGYPRRLEICGEKGSLALEEDSITRWDVSGMPVPADVQIQSSVSQVASVPTALGIEGHARQIRDMIEAIRYDRRPLVDQYEGRKPIEVIMAIYESSRTGKMVELAKDSDKLYSTVQNRLIVSAGQESGD